MDSAEDSLLDWVNTDSKLQHAPDIIQVYTQYEQITPTLYYDEECADMIDEKLKFLSKEITYDQLKQINMTQTKSYKRKLISKYFGNICIAFVDIIIFKDKTHGVAKHININLLVIY